jgi:hypothetical protein
MPSGTVNGVEANIERKASAAIPPNYVRDTAVKLVKGGTVSGDNKADTSNNWPTSDGTKTYGGGSDLWGLTLSQSDINASNFGFVLEAHLYAGPYVTITASVDTMYISVTYTAASTGYVHSFVVMT